MIKWQALRKYYDGIGRAQDTQRFYEDPPTGQLLRYAELETATSVIELGGGTGRFATKPLKSGLPKAASYRGFELSERIRSIAASRIREWTPPAQVTCIDEDPPLPLTDAQADRFIANYVLDLMGPEDSRHWLAEAHRVLAQAGLLCLVSITPGTSRMSRFVSNSWMRVWRRRPSLLGGCRPIELLDLLEPGQWTTLHCQVLTVWWVSSEVVVARRV